ncbi:hypothetical protein NQ314_012364 [Rhamnusium bicolor]|uniref:Cytohesin Ubiquitin Protein Inducing domain-containing protein n=1 Tax=Rhamnusium bicolor TaxID=1586634 RepID=A0AAV8XCZ8_9CUCU|nr:hypothetical protein NQ314_012364 [Rhamnusium bicolor]
MEDGVSVEDNKSIKMGATGNINATRITALQERKKHIEETLAKRNQELRQLCIQEAELTGITPPEMPLEPGETLPLIRRRVKTAFELPENLVENANKDTLITNLELQIQLHANLAEAALGLANEQNMSKTVKRQHRAEYQKHKSQCIALQEKLALLKERAASEQHKQKKKPRVPEQVDDNISVCTNLNEPFVKSDMCHSMRSMKHSLPVPNESCVDQRYSQVTSRLPYRNSDIAYDNEPTRQEEILNSGFYRLSLNGYSKYMERRENINNTHPSVNYSTHSSSFPYNLPHNSIQQLNLSQQHSPHYQQGSTLMSQHSPHLSQHSPHLSQHSPHSSQHNSHASQHSPRTSQHSPRMPQHSPRMSQHSPHMSQQHSPQLPQHSPQLAHQRSLQSVYSYPSHTEFSKFTMGNNHFSNTHLHRQSNSSSYPQKSQYFSSHTIHGQSNYRQYQNEGAYRNPHQIQPHQQYEQMGVIMTSGLGGCWKKTENGELVWCNSNTIDANWQRDKRRKNKRVHKRVSPSVDPKSATIASVPNYPNQVRNASVKSSQIINRRTQDNGQLVRTQSLGSVGAQTVDSVYPSDDNSSCESDTRSINDMNQILRKHKEKEWLETSLDGPVSPSQNSVTSPQTVIPSVLAPEEKYVVHSPPPLTPKSPLEIPAESNPCPRLPETNLELFNNNILKNCTIVQAGHCKPYHEETKPFEMSDFYKYSTKFKKSPIKAESKDPANTSYNTGNIQRNLNETFEDGPKSPYQPVSSKCQPYNNSTSNINVTAGSTENSGSLNTSLDLSHLAVSEHFSAEMNAWYKDQQKNNNNNTGTSSKK